MRISDCSSDVCSSDLPLRLDQVPYAIDHDLSVDTAVTGIGIVTANAVPSSMGGIEHDFFNGVRGHFPKVIDHGALRHRRHTLQCALCLPAHPAMISSGSQMLPSSEPDCRHEQETGREAARCKVHEV